MSSGSKAFNIDGSHWELHPLGPADVGGLLRVVQRAETGMGPLAANLVTSWIENDLEYDLIDGIAIGAYDHSGLVGFAKASRLQSEQYGHVLSGLVVAVDEAAQRIGIGRHLLEALIWNAGLLKPRIERIELIVKEGQAHALRLFESVGFRREGRFERRVKLSDRNYDAELPMAISIKPHVQQRSQRA